MIHADEICPRCDWVGGQHQSWCVLFSWNCNLCGALVNKRTEENHYKSHRALPISTKTIPDRPTISDDLMVMKTT